VTPYFFASGSRRLLGLYHAPEPSRPLRGAVIFCNPFGQEAIRSHRMYRVLADRVTRAGFAALRFDYSCTGDSEGDCTGGRIANWVEDIRAADREVVSRSGAKVVTWVGLRLGATLALLAADRDDSRDRRLVLWDPVMSGAPYLEEMARAHVGFLSSVFRWKPTRVARSRGINALRELPELAGFEISPGLRADVEALDMGVPRAIVARSVTILGEHDIGAYESLRAVIAARGIASDYVGIEADAPWDSEEALNASAIPARTLDALLAAVEKQS
jgi:exosortase A-associated hydrolase 2